MNELPGQRTTYASVTPRQIMFSTHGMVEMPGPLVIDSAHAYDGGNSTRLDEMRAGLIMAQITASKKWVPCKRTRVKTGTTGTVTALTVDNAAAFKVGEKISVGADTALLISAINYSTNTITIPSTAVVDGEVVIATTFDDGATTCAGAEIPRAVLLQTVRLLSGVPFETIWIDKAIVMINAGYLNASMILGDLAACRAATNYLSAILWSDQQQGA